MKDQSNKGFISAKDINLEKMKKYCAYQERSHSEVRNKLLQLKVFGDDLEEIMADLIVEGFLSEDRYARSYIRGKFRMNQWGRNKITNGLKVKKIPMGIISSAMEEIDEEEYRETLIKLLEKKNSTIHTKNHFERRKKLFTFAANKGYEYDILNEILDEMR